MKTVECGRCEGREKIEAFRHYAKGVCFACGGTGNVSAQSLTAQQEATRLAWYAIDVLERAAEEGSTNTPWLTSWCTRAAKHMLAMQNTETARKMLARVPAYRAEIIDIGRKLRAS